MADLEDHDKIIRLEESTDNRFKNTDQRFEGMMDTLDLRFKTVNTKLDDQNTLMTNHLKHHEAIEKTKSDRVFRVVSIVLQLGLGGGLAYLIAHLPVLTK